MKKSKITEREIATDFARSWNTLDPSHFIKHLGPQTQHHSQWVFESMRGRERITQYLTAKMQTIRNTQAQVNKITAELCAIRKGPFVFSSEKSPQSLARAQQSEEKLASHLDSFCVLITQEQPDEKKIEALVIFEVENGVLMSYCYCMPGIYRYRQLGVLPRKK